MDVHVHVCITWRLWGNTHFPYFLPQTIFEDLLLISCWKCKWLHYSHWLGICACHVKQCKVMYMKGGECGLSVMVLCVRDADFISYVESDLTWLCMCVCRVCAVHVCCHAWRGLVSYLCIYVHVFLAYHTGLVPCWPLAVYTKATKTIYVA